MAIAGIPEVINDFNLYLKGNKLGGQTGEVPLPDFEGITAAISGAGILGEFETVVTGHFGSMELEIPFRCICKDYFEMIDTTEAIDLTLRGAIQQTNPTTQGIDYVGMRVVTRGRCKKIKVGTVKQREGMDSAITQELTYILIEMDGKRMVELDKINPKYYVKDTDMLAKIRQLT